MNDRRSLWLFGVAGVFSLGQWLIASLWPTSSVVPLHYTIYFGIDLTGSAWQRYLIPAITAAIIIIHSLIASLQASVLWSRLWAIMALVSVILLSTALVTLRVVASQ